MAGYYFRWSYPKDLRMRRKKLVIGFTLVTLSAAAAFAVLSYGDDLRRGLPFDPTDLLAQANGQSSSGNPGTPPQDPSPGSQRNPYSALDLPLDTAKIYVADFSEETPGEAASEPHGGQGNVPTGGTSRPKDTQTGNNSSDGGNGPGFGGDGFPATGGGGTTRLFAFNSPQDTGTAPKDGPSGDGTGGAGPGDTDTDTDSGGKKSTETPDNLGGPQLDTNAPVTGPTVIDEPAPLSLLLVAGLALLIARRAKRRAAR
jgi:hypothetical protein